MDEKTYKPSINSSSTPSAITTSAQTYTIQHRRRIVENYLLLWLDGNIDETKKDCQNTLTQLRNIVDNIYSFTNTDECVDFLTEIREQKAFVIVSGTLGEHLVLNICEIPQTEAVYIYCSTESEHEQWTKKWPKVKGEYTDITAICGALQQAIKQSNQDSMPISFVPTTDNTFIQNLDKLEPSFMYTQIFKEILLEMEYSPQSLCDFTAYCRSGDDASITNINKFEAEYSSDSAIWWFTYPSFIYSMLNSALRTLESETIMKMGFFIRDLHHQIVKLHQEQFSGQHSQAFVVYRGQGLPNQEFSKLQKAKGGLIAFNSFLSTSKDETVSFGFAIDALSKPDSVGILFKITINPSSSPVPFALIDKVSHFKDEEEFLFSMHTVFRVGEIKTIGNNNCLYEVELQVTADNDEQLRTLTEQIRKETFPDAKGWHRMGQLLITLGHFNQAEQLYSVVLQQATGEEEKADIYYEFGRIKYGQSDYMQAISFYEKSLLINEKVLPSNYSNLASINNNIGSVYDHMGEYSKAISFYEKALEIFEKSPSPNHSLSANAHNNIGLVYENMGEYSKAILFYEKAFGIRQKTLPPNHPDLATSYNNIASVSYNMGEYMKALLFYKKSLQIRQETLPPNHPDLAESNNNIGQVYYIMDEYSEALSFYEKAVEILQKSFLTNHPSLAISYNNIALVYGNMGEYSKALSFYEKDLEICQKTLPPNHPSLATSYNNIASVYHNMGDDLKALSFYEKDLEICQKTLPPNHPDLAASYNNIGFIFKSIGNYSKALSYYERALDISQRSLPSNHPNLQGVRENIEFVKQKL